MFIIYCICMSTFTTTGRKGTTPNVLLNVQSLLRFPMKLQYYFLNIFKEMGLQNGLRPVSPLTFLFVRIGTLRLFFNLWKYVFPDFRNWNHMRLFYLWKYVEIKKYLLHPVSLTENADLSVGCIRIHK